MCGDYKTFSSLSKLKLNFNLERKLKSSNLIMVVDTIVDMMDQENNVPLFLRECGIVLQYTMPGNVRILEEVEFGKEENIYNVVFEEESVNDIGQEVLMSITIQETTLVIGDNVQTIVPNIVLEQDYDEDVKTANAPRLNTSICWLEELSLGKIKLMIYVYILNSLVLSCM
ncbi:hypothetical protein CR513_53949, partial [Mucuna pruriens]